MKKYHVEITDTAEAEAREAYLWIREDSPERAARWQKGLLKQIDRLETLPERCPLAPENAFFAEEIRQLLYGRRSDVYRIFLRSRMTLCMSCISGMGQDRCSTSKRNPLHEYHVE